MTPPLPTKFAPAERCLPRIIQAQASNFASLDVAKAVLDASPLLAAILNEQRQIVFCNRPLLNFAGVRDPDALFGARPGEAAACIHAKETEGGCGTTESCQTCGAVLSILEAQAGGANTRECRITRQLPGGGTESRELQVSTAPITVNGERFYVFSMADISHEKRRRALERIFFHDILNTAGGLRELAASLQDMVPPGDASEFAGLLKACAEQLVGEIQSQRELAAAELSELALQLASVGSRDLIEQEVARFRGYPAAQGRFIKVDDATVDAGLITDPALLGRVLGNMLKNALEASAQGQTVTIGCRMAGQSAEFWVHNQSVMPKQVQLQIFQRSFSTKGGGRGLGTYSMKLLTERYLGGEVGFTSESGSGTRFFARYPLDLRSARSAA